MIRLLEDYRATSTNGQLIAEGTVTDRLSGEEEAWLIVNRKAEKADGPAMSAEEAAAKAVAKDDQAQADATATLAKAKEDSGKGRVTTTKKLGRPKKT